ncbi:MAG: hypothetical protein Q9164_007957, partial [Protoblastenia rupestris]
VAVDGLAVASHLPLNEYKDLESTDLLERYRAYAEERVCQDWDNVRNTSIIHRRTELEATK